MRMMKEIGNNIDEGGKRDERDKRNERYMLMFNLFHTSD